VHGECAIWSDNPRYYALANDNVERGIAVSSGSGVALLQGIARSLPLLDTTIQSHCSGEPHVAKSGGGQGRYLAELTVHDDTSGGIG
jgi:hypothetical protein